MMFDFRDYRSQEDQLRIEYVSNLRAVIERVRQIRRVAINTANHQKIVNNYASKNNWTSGPCAPCHRFSEYPQRVVNYVEAADTFMRRGFVQKYGVMSDLKMFEVEK